MPFIFKEWPMASPPSHIFNYPATTMETSKTPETQCMWSKSAPPSQWLELWSPSCSGHSPMDCHSCLNLSGSFPQRPTVNICHSDFLMPWILSLSLQHCLWNSVCPTLNSNHSLNPVPDSFWGGYFHPVMPTWIPCMYVPPSSGLNLLCWLPTISSEPFPSFLTWVMDISLFFIGYITCACNIPPTWSHFKK